MKKIEKETAFDERVVDAVNVPHRVAHLIGAIEPLRALAHDHGDIGNGRIVGEMCIALCEPVEILISRLLPAAVGAQALFRRQ